MKKACVIGWPVAHSRSPFIHGYWLKRYGLEGNYERVAVVPQELGDFVRRLRGGEFAGCNVTLPHKVAIVPYLDELLPQAVRSGSVNTIYWSGTFLVGTSTDGTGFADSVAAATKDFRWAQQRVLILGAGGTARAIIAELLHRQVASIAVWNRSAQRAAELAEHFGGEVHTVHEPMLANAADSADVIVNTTSAGLAGSPPLQFPFAGLRNAKVVADTVYVPLISPFLSEAQKTGHHIVPGIGMLLHQAALGFEMWFGHRPEVTRELYDLLAADIEQKAVP